LEPSGRALASATVIAEAFWLAIIRVHILRSAKQTIFRILVIISYFPTVDIALGVQHRDM